METKNENENKHSKIIHIAFLIALSVTCDYSTARLHDCKMSFNEHMCVYVHVCARVYVDAGCIVEHIFLMDWYVNYEFRRT